VVVCSFRVLNNTHEANRARTKKGKIQTAIRTWAERNFMFAKPTNQTQPERKANNNEHNNEKQERKKLRT
jgi:hypothetical protein